MMLVEAIGENIQRRRYLAKKDLFATNIFILNRPFTLIPSNKIRRRRFIK